MIYLWSGKTGSGKTNQMVKSAYRQWRKGRDIYTNTILYFTYTELHEGFTIKQYPRYFKWYEFIEQFLYEILKVEKVVKRGRIVFFNDLSEIYGAEKGCIFFDEGQDLFDAQNWENLDSYFKHKIRQHRKDGLDIYTTTQNIGTVDISYRRIVQKWYHCRTLFRIPWIRGKELIGLHAVDLKDVDKLRRSSDDEDVPVLKTKLFLIHLFKRELYNSMYKIPYRRFKCLWINPMLENISRKVWWIIPKEMELNQVQRVIFSRKSSSGKKMYQNLKKN